MPTTPDRWTDLTIALADGLIYCVAAPPDRLATSSTCFEPHDLRDWFDTMVKLAERL